VIPALPLDNEDICLSSRFLPLDDDDDDDGDGDGDILMATMTMMRVKKVVPLARSCKR